MSDESTARAAKRRILKADNPSEERQMVLGVAPSARRTSKLNDDQRPSDASRSGSESVPGGAGVAAHMQGPPLGNESKMLQRVLGEQLHEIRQEFSNLVRTHHQAISSELRAVQLEITANIKGGQSAVATRLERVAALLEHRTRVAAVEPESGLPWPRLGRGSVVVVTIIATVLVLAIGLRLIG